MIGILAVCSLCSVTSLLVIYVNEQQMAGLFILFIPCVYVLQLVVVRLEMRGMEIG